MNALTAILGAAATALASVAQAQGPALILTPDPGAVTFTIGGAPADGLPPYRINVNAQGQLWDARSGTPWVSVVARDPDLYLSVTREAWDLGPGITHCATVALQARTRDDAGVSTAAVADSAQVNVCVVRSR